MGRLSYAYIYPSNESSLAVYFDDFQVSHERGAIIEETHYYPHGLKIASLCSKAYNKLPNKYAYQGDFSEEEAETGYDEFDLRMYDPQIGRWIQSDPYNEFASGYIGMGNDPANKVDPDGGGIFDGPGAWGFLAGAAFGTVSATLIARNNDASNKEIFNWGVAGFFGGGLLGLGASQIPWGQLFNSLYDINIFVTGTNLGHNFSSAPFADFVWATVKSIFSFGRLRIIQANDLDDLAFKIENIMGSTVCI